MKTWSTTGGCIITRLLFGRCNVYLVSREGRSALVDTGWAGDGKRLLEKLRTPGPPEEVIMTHTHFDHAGNACRIRNAFNPLFVVHESEKGYLETGDSPLPGGTRRWSGHISRVGRERVPHWFHVPGVEAGLTVTDRLDLERFGLPGFVLHTPGHSPGSVSVIVDHEIALVGDTMIGYPWSVWPAWGDDASLILKGWETLLATGSRLFLPGHGMAIGRERLEKEFEKKSRVTRHV